MDTDRYPVHEFRQLRAVAIMVLLGTILVENSVAMLLRNPYEPRW